MPDRKPSYWAVLPAVVRYDAELPPNAKLLYAEISSLCDDKGYCFASNEYFARNFGLSVKSVQRLIKALADHGLVQVEVIRDPESKAVLERRIFAGINPAKCSAPPSPQNCGDPSPQNCGDPSPQKCGIEQSNSINTTPQPPKGGKRVRGKTAPREAPNWNPSRFAGLWSFYPAKGRKNKQAAMDAWDNLKPSDELINTIAKALVKLKATDDWQRGIGIPHVSTFLNNARWEDAEALDEPDGTQPGGWAEDKEVL